ncbi:lysozyme inhibitor LprI family protein [Pseudophaeobacter sp. TrK17]|uniref:lysozyme inhibitor LprI family protein n=1 Tax=Pseudophaeobacter sp. TrK17 TaxID=2815167 RepID=UPI0035CF5646
MEISYLLTFFGGVAADIARKVFIPQTEEWLESILPHKRKARNVKRNMLQLEVREKLEKMGKDPSLARHVEDDAEEFLRRLDERHEAQREALVELEADRLLQNATTQVEMNMAAGERLQEADENLATAIERLKRKGGLSENAIAALDKAQRAWEEFRAAQGEFEGLAMAEGGSMQPMVHALAMADMTVDRTLNIAAMRKGLSEM